MTTEIIEIVNPTPEVSVEEAPRLEVHVDDGVTVISILDGVPTDVGPPGPPGTPGVDGQDGAPGQDGAGGVYVHTQGLASTTWTVVHNLGVYPNITTVDSAGSAFEAAVHYDSTNQITITLAVATSGTAYLS